MSKISSLVLGLVSGAAMFGAIQYASGNDLRGTLNDGAMAASSPRIADTTNPAIANTMVNRSNKGNRAVAASPSEASQTLSFRVHGLSDTSVLLRLAANPVATPPKVETGKALPVSVIGKLQKSAVACEPPVSVLTEVARLMQPGRCVT
jgi:hypothetical protein